MISRRILQDELLKSESSLSLRKVRFTTQEFSTRIPVSNVKYYHQQLQNNKPFYLFHDQLGYVLAHYFSEFETIKGNVDKFLFKWLIAVLTEKVSYQNANK